MKIIILDNILPPETNIRIIEELCNHHWFIAFDIKNDRTKKIFFKKNNGFSINTVLKGNVIVNSILNFYGYIIFDIIKEKINIKAKIYRLYWNMYFKESETELHVDMEENGYKSIIYNLHTTDGGTEIENYFYPDKLGQAKIFDSNLLHKGIGPTKDNVRFNLNIIYK
jgi:hypothetical protein